MGLILDIVVGAVVIGLLVLVPSVAFLVYRRKRMEDPEQQFLAAKQRVLADAFSKKESGEINVIRMQTEHERLCYLCGKFTDPYVDLFLEGKWVHRACHEAPKTTVNN